MARGKHETGMSRLALSDADRQVRDWFVHTTKSLGCRVDVDAMGNIFAVRPGWRTGFPPTCAGSHLDTQPTGGRYDGILGVCAGVEMLRVLHEEKTETEFPVGVVNWTNEEGARFPISMISSGVWAGEISLEKAHNLKEVGPEKRTMKQELERIGYLGHMDASYKVMPLGYGALASTGIIQAAPGSTNTVPGWVQFSLDIRAENDVILMEMEEHLKSEFDQLVRDACLDGLDGERIRGQPCSVEWMLDSTSSATKFDDRCINCVRQSAGDVFGHQSAQLQSMISGAGNVRSG
ncbi:MAG: hypothetical protein Q9218_000965 [Villophora microphyllina]